MSEGWSEHGDDDDASSIYPAAPIPPHERQWRHPSELGPSGPHVGNPISLGRGLVITAGIVGVAAVVGMVWLMSPTESPVRAGSATSVGRLPSPPQPTSTFRAVPSLPPSTTAMPTTTSPPPQPSLTTGLTAAPTSPKIEPGATTPPTDSSTTQYSGPLTTLAIAASGQPALLWPTGEYAITAADGMSADIITEIRLPDGKLQQAAVLTVSDGIAIVAIAGPSDGTPLDMAEMADVPAAGTQVSIESTGGVKVATLEAGPSGEPVLDAVSDAPTGCAVRDPAGSLIGVTVPGSDGDVRVLTVARIDELVEAARHIGGRLGIKGRSVEGGGVVISVVEAGSPAESVGLLPGDQINSVDGQAITSIDHLVAMLRTSRGGRSVTLSLVRNGNETQVVVVLGSRQPGTTTTGNTSSPQSTVAIPTDSIPSATTTTDAQLPQTTSVQPATIPHGTSNS